MLVRCVTSLGLGLRAGRRPWSLVPSCELLLSGGQLGVNSPGNSKPVQNCGNAETNVPVHTLLIFPEEPAWCFSLHAAGEQQREACTVLAIAPPPPAYSS